MDAVFSIMPQFPSGFQGAAGIFSQKAAPPASKHTSPLAPQKASQSLPPVGGKEVKSFSLAIYA
ncbi:MAG: hypothetical protein ACLUVS_04540 [Oscillospiraceae bacterium]|jgi:hypothetical protein